MKAFKEVSHTWATMTDQDALIYVRHWMEVDAEAQALPLATDRLCLRLSSWTAESTVEALLLALAGETAPNTRAAAKAVNTE